MPKATSNTTANSAAGKLLKTALPLAVALLIGFSSGHFLSAEAQQSKVFELRVYTATPGNLDKLHSRFRDHTTRIFRKHGMEVVGYWTPTDPQQAEDTLIYILEHASQEAASASWLAFSEDSEWQEVAAASNAEGAILQGIERSYMTATDFSPMQ